jgi:hypothetical protein
MRLSKDFHCSEGVEMSSIQRFRPRSGLPSSLSPLLLPSAKLSICQTHDNGSTDCSVPVASSYDDGKDNDQSSSGIRLELTRRTRVMSYMMHSGTEDLHRHRRRKGMLSRFVSGASTANAVLSAKDHETKIEFAFVCNTQIVCIAKFSIDPQRPTCVVVHFTGFVQTRRVETLRCRCSPE